MPAIAPVISLAAALFVLLSPVACFAQERMALVMGNGRYQHALPLPNPPNDARDVARALQEIGFHVTEGTDLDRASMDRMLREFLRQATKARIALLYYAGHGLQINNRNYLVPVDAKIEVPSDLDFAAIEVDRTIDHLTDASRANVIILDACRDNPLSRSLAARLGTTRSAAVGSGLAGYSNVGTGTLIAFATAPGQIALDGEGVRNSPFTAGLLKHLRTPGLELRQMFTRVRADVVAATRNRQIPWDNSSLLGEVYLASAPAHKAAPPHAPSAQAASPPAPAPAVTRSQDSKVHSADRASPPPSSDPSSPLLALPPMQPSQPASAETECKSVEGVRICP